MVCPHCQAANLESDDNCFRCGKGLFSLTEAAVLNGRYEVLQSLGRGGMGMVYLGRDRELEEPVAIKVLRPELARAPAMAKRFRSEIRLARRVRHRNVCAIHEYGQDGHVQYIVMEYVAGIDCKRLLRENGPLPWEQAFDVAIQLAMGLQAVHDVGIIHRDLKTPNVMMDSQGAVRLMDFGIAKSELDGLSAATATGQIIGTPEYMSPEQVRGEKVDHRSDIYALGIVVYELFTGDVPFRGDTPVATLFKHLQDAPLFEAHTDTIPAPLVSVLTRALAKDRGDRHASAEEVAESLIQARAQTLGAGIAKPRAVFGSAAVARQLSPTPSELAAPTPTPMWSPTPMPGPSVVTAPAAPIRGISPLVAVLAGAGGALVAVAAALWFFMGLRRGVELPAPASGQMIEADAAAVARSVLARAAPPTPAGTSASSPSPPTAEVPLRSGAPPAPRATRHSPARVPAATAAVPRASDPGPGPSTVVPAPVAMSTDAFLQIGVRPFADVTLDGQPIGTTPLPPVKLLAGAHTITLQHPAFRPIQRKFTVRPNETYRLIVDFTLDGLPK